MLELLIIKEIEKHFDGLARVDIAYEDGSLFTSPRYHGGDIVNNEQNAKVTISSFDDYKIRTYQYNRKSDNLSKISEVINKVPWYKRLNKEDRNAFITMAIGLPIVLAIAYYFFVVC